MRAGAWHLGARGAVVLVLVLCPLPTLSSATNPHHLDTARAFLRGSVWIDEPTKAHDLEQIDGRWISPFPPLPCGLNNTPFRSKRQAPIS